jgi:hypothetical protein
VLPILLDKVLPMSPVARSSVLEIWELYRAHKAPLVVLTGGVMPWNKGLPPESALMSEIMQVLPPRKSVCRRHCSAE